MTLDSGKLTVYDTPQQIERYKRLCLMYALAWQARGKDIYDLIPRGSPTPLQVLRRDYNFRGRTAMEGLKFASCLMRQANEGR